MQLQETLTKENFWNRMMELYPNATKKFCEWVDEYKKEVNWKILFNCGKDKNYGTNFNRPVGENGRWDHDIKFHDIPHAMQTGIWLEYLSQRGGCVMEIENFFEFDLAKDIEGMFRELLEEEAKDEYESASS